MRGSSAGYIPFNQITNTIPKASPNTQISCKTISLCNAPLVSTLDKGPFVGKTVELVRTVNSGESNPVDVEDAKVGEDVK